MWDRFALATFSVTDQQCQCSPLDRLALDTLDVTEQESPCTLLNRSAFDTSPGSSASVENTVQRNRKDALPLTLLRKGGSEQVAFEIARSSRLVDEALFYYRRLTYTQGAMAAKCEILQESLAGITVCEESRQPYPRTPVLVEKCSAALRKAGYRSAYLYTCEAQQQPLEASGRRSDFWTIGSSARRREPKT